MGVTPAEPVTGLPVPKKWIPMLPIGYVLARLNVPPASVTAPEPRVELLMSLTIPPWMVVPPK